MVTVLNFGLREKKDIKRLIKNFPDSEKKDVKTDFEEYRCKIWDTTITLYTSGKTSIQGKNEDKVKEWILSSIELENELMLGIDETGRGEKTGPMVIAGVFGNTDQLRELRDSKKMTKLDDREKVVSKEMLASVIVSLNAEYIDTLRKRGINLNQMEVAAMNGIYEFFQKMEKGKLVAKVDGSRMNGADKNLEFVVKGDDTIPVISAASIVAKTARDRSKDKKIRKTWNA